MTSSETPFAPLTVGDVLDLGDLMISWARDGQTGVLALTGELDVASAPEAEAQLRSMENAARVGEAIVLDLRGLTFIDSTGLRLLIEANVRAGVAAHRLRFIQPNQDVFRVCEIAGLDTLLSFEAEEAVNRNV